MVRSKYGQGGRNGNPSKHDTSIIIEAPKNYKNTKVSVPHKDSGDEMIIKSGKNKIRNDKVMKLIKSFIEKNTTDIRAIYYSQDEKHVENSYKHMIRYNLDIIKNIKSDNDPELVEYFKKKKGKL